MTQDSELPYLSLQQIEILRRFVLFEARIEDVRNALAGVFDFDFDGAIRTASVRFRIPEPGLVITRGDLQNAIERKRLGKISEEELVFWATMLLLNDAFEPDPNDQEFVAEWLNDVSFNGYSGREQS